MGDINIPPWLSPFCPSSGLLALPCLKNLIIGVSSSMPFSFLLCLHLNINVSGECGVVLEDVPLEDNEQLDELEKHYKENVLKMEKHHIKFLDKDQRFKFSTSCSVCAKDFSKSYGLLRHITDKVKSKKNDWKLHEEFLESVLSGFWG